MSAINWTAIQTALVTWFTTATGLTDRVYMAGQNPTRPPGDGACIALRFFAIQTIGHDWSNHEVARFTFADKEIEDITGNEITITAHGFKTGDGPVNVETDDTLPAGIASDETPVWIIRTGADTFKLATSFLNAINLSELALVDAGVGTHTVVDNDETLRAGAELTHYARGQRRITLQVTCFPPKVATDGTEAYAYLSDAVGHASLPARRSALRAAGIGLGNMGTIQQLDGVVNSTRFEPRAMLTLIMFVKSEITATGTIIETVNVTEAVGDPPQETDFTVDLS